METSQLIIKIVLITVFALFAVFLLLPGRGVRHDAIRKLTMLSLFAVAILAVVFPNAINAIANVMGVGRGADLLLYGLIIVVVGNSIVTQRRQRLLETQITILARKMAIAQGPAARPATISTDTANVEPASPEPTSADSGE